MKEKSKISLYDHPPAMEPLYPDDPTGYLDNLAVKLVEKASNLFSSIHPYTREAIADFLRPINSYYSNLIEGHDTHPIDIDRALKNDYSENKEKRELQLEASAHINVHKLISEKFLVQKVNPYNFDFIRLIHAEFYKHLPDSFRETRSLEGLPAEVIPGEIRTKEVKVGRHIGPSSPSLNLFIDRFESYYNPESPANKLRTKRIISIAASHHRLAWIHPFIDGNGRVIRLFSDANFMYEDLDGSGLWSMSRGLARKNAEYKQRLANADHPRWGNHDGRGNLSNKMLVEFCAFFLETAIDQVEFMLKVLDIDSMLGRIESYIDIMSARKVLRPETKYVLETVFLKGEIARRDVERVTGKSDKTAKAMADSLLAMGLLKTDPDNRFAPYRANYSLASSPVLFPGLYPGVKEVEIMRLSRP